MIPLLPTDCSEFLRVVTTNFCVTVARSVHRLTPPVSPRPPAWRLFVARTGGTAVASSPMGADHAYTTTRLYTARLRVPCESVSRRRPGARRALCRRPRRGVSTPRPSTSPGRDLSAPPQRDAALRARRLTPRNLLLHRGPACVRGGDSHDHSPSSDRHTRPFAFIMPTLLNCSTDYPKTRSTSS